MAVSHAVWAERQVRIKRWRQKEKKTSVVDNSDRHGRKKGTLKINVSKINE